MVYIKSFYDVFYIIYMGYYALNYFSGGDFLNYLFVVAHPDDEVLGAGGTISKLIKEGNKVDVCIMSANVTARTQRPNDNELKADLYKDK